MNAAFMPFQPYESGIHAVCAELEPATAKDHQSQQHPGKQGQQGSHPDGAGLLVDSQVRDRGAPGPFWSARDRPAGLLLGVLH